MGFHGIVMFATIVTSVLAGFVIARTLSNNDAYWRGYSRAMADVELTHGIPLDGDSDGEPS